MISTAELPLWGLPCHLIRASWRRSHFKPNLAPTDALHFILQKCDYTIEGLRDNVPAALAHVSNRTISACFNSCMKKMDLYRRGLAYGSVEWKKLTSHQKVYFAGDDRWFFFWQKRHGWVTWNFSLVPNWNGLFLNGYGFVWVHGEWGPGGGPKKFFLTKSVSCLARINHTFPDPYGVLAIVTLFIDRFSLVLRCLLTFKACCCCGEATLVCRLPRVTLEYPPP
jgi:hypothetical protein